MKNFTLIIMLLLLTASANAQFNSSKISGQLESTLQTHNENENVRVIIMLKDKVDVELYKMQLDSQPLENEEKSKRILNALKDKAVNSQLSLLQDLQFYKNAGGVQEFESFWIINAVSAVANVRVVKALTFRNDIELIEVDNEIFFDEEVSSSPSGDNPASVETGLKVIKADILWKLGYTGQGRLVMNIDSGVDGNHRALRHKWKGNSTPWYHAWMDANGGSFPNYCSSHGTHTMGTLCGRDTVTADTVGVCPDAKWMAAKRSCAGNYSTFALTVFQWSMDPDSNSSTPDYPDVVNCSWNTNDPGAGECNGSYKTMFTTLAAFGIAVVYSAGNNGPGASSISSPKNINTDEVNVFTVGAIDGNNSSYPIASFSSRGPSICGGTGSLLIKPEVSAPGVNVRSSNPNNQYGNSSGTSMASPHAAGSVALLKSFAPRLNGPQILRAIYHGATDLGSAGEDNTFGKGLVNLVQAMVLLGPSINHTPLSNTTNLSGPYTVSADITPSAITGCPVDTAQLKVYWGRNSITDSIVMQRQSGNTFTANIPGNGTSATYLYYISTIDTLDVKGHSPGDAPLNVHSFFAGVTGITSGGTEIPAEFLLEQNFPNPFNPSTSIKFDIAEQSLVKIVVYDAIGREMGTLVNNDLSPGKYSVDWNASAFPSGVYFYRINAGQYTAIRKMMLVK
jgi:subtilisin family serine protease